MAIPVTSTHRAVLDLPVSGNPAQRPSFEYDSNRHVVSLVATSTVSQDAARALIVKFLEDALEAARR